MSNPYPVFGSQNLKDDDGAVIDSFLIETDTAPKPALEPITVTELKNPLKVDRIVGTPIVLLSGWDVVLLLPSDPFRKSLTIYVYSIGTTPGTPIPTDGIRLSDETGRTYGGRILHGGTISIDYTGPVYVFGTGGLNPVVTTGSNVTNTGPVSVEVWAVTANV